MDEDDTNAHERERADREFRDLLVRLLSQPAEVAKLSPARLEYAKLGVRAFDWWIDTGHASGVPDDHSTVMGLEAGTLAPRDNIMLSFVLVHPGTESLHAARVAIKAQRERMAASRD